MAVSFLLCIFAAVARPPSVFPEDDQSPARSVVPAPIFTGLITADRVNLRAGPGLSYEVIRQFPKRDKVLVFEERGDWYGIELPSDVAVYVSGDHVRSLQNGKTVADADRLHVRSGPGAAFASVGTLHSGEQVIVRKRVRDWAQIDPPVSCRGWISKSYVVELEVKEEGKR